MQQFNAPLASLADDIKLGGAVDSLEGQEALQRDLDRLEHWTMINGMKFNKSKCQILHLGWNNTRHKYRFEEQWLTSSPAERDLGELVSSKLNTSQHSMTRRSKVIILLYSVLMWPQLCAVLGLTI